MGATRNMAQVYSHDNSSSFAANLRNAVDNAQGEYILLLGDDDIITKDEILNLEEFVSQNAFMNLGFTNLISVADVKPRPGIKLSSLDAKPIMDLSSAQSCMRAGSLPGILIAKNSLRVDVLDRWLKLFPTSIYPQIVLALAAQIGERKKAVQLPINIRTGLGDGFLDPTFDRLHDYGVEERLMQAKFLSSIGVIGQAGVARLQINLAIWVSVRFQRNHVDYPEITNKIFRRQLLLFPHFPLFATTLATHRILNQLVFPRLGNGSESKRNNSE